MKDLSQHLLPLHKDLLQKYLTLVDLKSQCPMLTFSQRISGDKYHSELKRKKVSANHCHIHCMMTFRLLKQYNQPSYQIYHLSHYDLLHFNKIMYFIFHYSLTSKSNFKLCSFSQYYSRVLLLHLSVIIRPKGGRGVNTDTNLFDF